MKLTSTGNSLLEDWEAKVRTTFEAEEARNLPREVPSFQPLSFPALMKGPLVPICEWTEVPKVPDCDDHEGSADLQPDLGSQGGGHQVEE